MSIEAIRELETLASVCPELNMANYTEDDVRHLNDWAIEMSLLAEKVAAIQQAEAQQPATGEPVEDGIRNAEDELNCAEEVLDAITCEFSDGEFPVTDFNCIGDYITAVVDVFKERLAAQQPATGEPLGFTYQAEIAYADSTGGNGSFWRVPPDLDDEAVPLYTHPAPSVPDVDFELQELREIERAMDDFADCGETDVVDTLLLRAVQAGFLECTHFHVANRGALQEAIDDAMLAAKEPS